MKLMPFRLFFACVVMVLSSLAFLLMVQGCSSTAYYHQAVMGQYEVLSSREDISQLINDPETAPELKEKLNVVLEAREFASNQMQMSVDDSYTQYSDLQRDYVVWNVTASPALELAPYEWCYPIIGCQSYRGYFHQEMAEKTAEQLTNQGYDTWVGGVAAYSTLGWFNDPVLNTFVYRNDADLFALLIHELSHQILYVKGDTTFNESFATSVELEGLKRWLRANEQEALFVEYKQKLQEKEHFISSISGAIDRLNALYSSDLPDNKMMIEKEEIIASLKRQYYQDVETKKLKGYFKHWFDRVNNAKLASISNYYEYVPAFNAMIEETKGDMAAFYKLAIQLGEQTKSQRDDTLKGYLERHQVNSNKQVIH